MELSNPSASASHVLGQACAIALSSVGTLYCFMSFCCKDQNKTTKLTSVLNTLFIDSRLNSSPYSHTVYIGYYKMTVNPARYTPPLIPEWEAEASRSP